MNTRQIREHNERIDKLMKELNERHREFNEATDRLLKFQERFDIEFRDIFGPVNRSTYVN